MSKNRKTPRTIRTFDEVCRLPRDNVTSGDAWVILNSPSEIVIVNQRIGQKSTGEVRLSRRQFNRFIKWWETGL